MLEAEAFEAQRPLLFGIAYRMLGSVAEAEDAVQDTFMRSSTYSAAQLENPRAFLATVITRICLDRLKSAQRQREQYIGPWLPEPLVTDGSFERVELHESISIAFLTLLERLSPPERAVFLLREVFDYPYPQIATIVGKSEAACRQLFHRARSAIDAARPRFTADTQAQEAIIMAFLQAAGAGELAPLEHLLAEDVMLWSDGGGKVQAARKPLHGRTSVARFIQGIVRRTPPNVGLIVTTINGAQALVALDGSAPLMVMTFEHAEGRIHAMRLIANPDKLNTIKQSLGAG